MKYANLTLLSLTAAFACATGATLDETLKNGPTVVTNSSAGNSGNAAGNGNMSGGEGGEAANPVGGAGEGPGGGGAGGTVAGNGGSGNTGGMPENPVLNMGGAGAGGMGASGMSAGGMPGGGMGGMDTGGESAGGMGTAGMGTAGMGTAGTPGAGGTGGAAGDLVLLLTNRNVGGARRYVRIGANDYLHWTATSPAEAEVFERVTISAGQIKLRASSTGDFVGIDLVGIDLESDADDDLLLANTDEAGAAVINTPLCAATNSAGAACAPNCRGLEVTNDNSSRFVVSDDQGVAAGDRLRSRSSDCGAVAGAWESWEIIEL